MNNQDSCYVTLALKKCHMDVVKRSGVKKCFIWVKVFKNGPSKICGRQPLKNLKRCGLLRQTISLQDF